MNTLLKIKNPVWFTALALIWAIFHVYAFDTSTLHTVNNVGFVASMLVFIVGFLIVSALQKSFKNMWALLLLVPVAVLLGDILFYQSDFVQSLAPLFTETVLFFFVLMATNEHREWRVWCLGVFAKPVAAISQGFRDFFGTIQLKQTREWMKPPHRRQIMKGILLALPALLVFFALFSSADPIFGQTIHAWFNLDFFGADQIALIDDVIYAVIFTVLAGLVFFIALGASNQKTEWKTKFALPEKTTLITFLVLINLLFAAFNYIQIRYVLLGQHPDVAFFTQNNLTYAEYTHNGFNQLVAACAIVGVIILGFYLFRPHHKREGGFDIAQIALVAQTLIVAASAMKRLDLYQEAYGYTILRLHVLGFMYLLIALLVCSIIALAINAKLDSYLGACAVLALIAAVAIFTAPLEKIVGENSIARYQAGQTIDVAYLTTLSADIVPSLQKLVTIQPTTEQKPDEPHLQQVIADKIQAEFKAFRDNQSQAGWRFWNANAAALSNSQ